MKLLKILPFLLFTTITFSQTQVQTNKQQGNNKTNTIEEYFTKMYNKSANYQVYKVIKKTDFQLLKNTVIDSIKTIKSNLKDTQNKITTQEKTISDLKEQITKINTDLETAKSKEQSMSLFGANISKNMYNTILWSIIIGLLAGFLFFIFKFSNSNKLTKNAKSNLAEIDKEFEEYRKKSIEREQKLRRQLQDEINKQRGVS